MQPLVSVMVPTRNRLVLLQQALRSVYAQDYPHLEVLVVDDASQDGTSDYIRSHYPDIRLFRFEKNQAQLVARNLMMKEASGEYIISLDSDAYFVNTDAISKVVERIQREPEIGIVALRVMGHEDERTQARDVECYANQFVGCAACIRKGILGDTGAFREFLVGPSEESDLALRLLDKGYRILYFPEAVVVHEESEVARDFVRLHIYGPRNLLLNSWINEPFPWWLLSTSNAVVKYLLRGVARKTLAYVLKGFWAAVKELPRVATVRRPVSSKTMRIYLTLRQRRITDFAEMQKLYESPPSAVSVLLVKKS